jgi:tetratricopeptide (TPR) repeat protein
LLQQGGSLSGRERNCCFLNLGSSTAADRRFADISAVAELDFPDDARAIAIVDWDQDGDQDLWIANRTSPRVRFLCNESPNHGDSLMVRLEGVHCNRDALGARLELRVPGETGRRHVRTVHAGSGFLSQSSRWIHFGVPKTARVSDLIVHWPGQREPETVATVRAGHRYWIRQGDGVVDSAPLQRPMLRWPAATSAAPVVEPFQRTIVVGRVPLPPLAFRDSAGADQSSSEWPRSPTLVNIWASTCPACQLELREWTEVADKIHAAGISVIALNADVAFAAGNEANSRHTWLDEIQFPFPRGTLAIDALTALDAFQRSFFDHQATLPVPTSLLLDAHQRVIAIYRGRVPVDQWIADAELLTAPPDVVRAAITRLPGRWLGPLSRPKILDMATALGAAGFPPRRYLEHCLDLQRSVPPDDPYRLTDVEQSDLHFALGTELLQQRLGSDAMREFQRAVRLNPRHRQAHANLGAAYFQAQRWRDAEEHFSRAIEIDPADTGTLVNRGLARLRSNKTAMAMDDFQKVLELDPADIRANFNLGVTLRSLGQHEQAVTHLRRALASDPHLTEPAMHLAWILATSRLDTVRNGTAAVRIAERLAEATEHQEPQVLDLLAVALAESGDFTAATRTIKRAISLAERKRDVQSVRQFQTHRQLILERKPIRM